VTIFISCSEHIAVAEHTRGQQLRERHFKPSCEPADDACLFENVQNRKNKVDRSIVDRQLQVHRQADLPGFRRFPKARESETSGFLTMRRMAEPPAGYRRADEEM
jgi:hypothetical protein